MIIRLTNTGSSEAMERHYQRLIEAGWGADVSKETETIKGIHPILDIEETKYYISAKMTQPNLIFDLFDVLRHELIITREDDQPCIEIYDDWRE